MTGLASADEKLDQSATVYANPSELIPRGQPPWPDDDDYKHVYKPEKPWYPPYAGKPRAPGWEEPRAPWRPREPYAGKPRAPGWEEPRAPWRPREPYARTPELAQQQQQQQQQQQFGSGGQQQQQQQQQQQRRIG